MGKFAPSGGGAQVPEGFRLMVRPKARTPQQNVRSILGGEDVDVDDTPVPIEDADFTNSLLGTKFLERIPTAEEISARNNREGQLRRRGQGLRSTQLSGASGPLSGGNIRRKTLLGE